MKEKIDIVILWVDGQDKEWIEKKNKWALKCGEKIHSPERFRNWDNLQYLFRGIEKFASWVNHVYLITDNQKPKWLDEKNKKVTVVDHSQIISEKNLPLFNSSAIEINIHKIPGLSEKFVYFNDDMFLIQPTQPTDFFKNNLPVDLAALNPLYAETDAFSQSVINNVKIINDNFDKRKVIKANFFNWYSIKYGPNLIRTILLSPYSYFTGFHNTHICTPFLKSTFKEVWSRYESVLNEATASKFRSDKDYTQWLFQYWQFASNKFFPRSYKFGKHMSVDTISTAEKCAKIIKKQNHKVICINDNEKLDDFYKSKKIINQAFNQILPDKSSFEK